MLLNFKIRRSSSVLDHFLNGLTIQDMFLQMQNEFLEKRSKIRRRQKKSRERMKSKEWKVKITFKIRWTWFYRTTWIGKNLFQVLLQVIFQYTITTYSNVVANGQFLWTLEPKTSKNRQPKHVIFGSWWNKNWTIPKTSRFQKRVFSKSYHAFKSLCVVIH